MVLIGARKRFGGDGVGTLSAVRRNGGLQPSLLDPETNLFLPYMQRSRKALQGEQVATNFPHAEPISLQHASNRLGRAAEFPRDLVHRPLHNLLAHEIDFLVRPATVGHSPLDPILNNEAPASFAGASRMALQSNDQLLKFVSGEDLGLSGKSQGLRTPALGALGGRGEICHTCLARGGRFEEVSVRNHSFRSFDLGQSRTTGRVSAPNRVET
jgi:hypothetical protein